MTISRKTGRVLLIFSIALIAAIAYPWNDLQDHSHWARVGWIPFLSPPVRFFDIVANVVLFVPLGVAVAATSRKPIMSAGLFALAVSIAVESLQLYSHSRFPSATDVVCNVVGAISAAYLVVRRTRSHADQSSMR